MTDVTVLLGQGCAPNMVAYLDGRLAEGDDLTVLTTGEDVLPRWLQHRDDVAVATVPVETATGAGRVRAAARAVRQHLHDRGADRIEQITQPHWHIPAVVLGARGCDVRTRVRLAGSVLAEGGRVDGWRPWVTRCVFPRAAALADEVVTPAHDPCPSLAGIEPREVAMPVNTQRFSAGAQPAADVWTQTHRRVLTVGRVSKQKGLDTVLDVAAELPNHEFAIAGGVRDAELATQALNMDNVRLLGHREYRSMPGLYVAADCVLSCSRLEWGGISRAMVEARACETPVVARDLDDAATVANRVANGPAGFAAAVSDLAQTTQSSEVAADV